MDDRDRRGARRAVAARRWPCRWAGPSATAIRRSRERRRSNSGSTSRCCRGTRTASGLRSSRARSGPARRRAGEGRARRDAARRAVREGVPGRGARRRWRTSATRSRPCRCSRAPSACRASSATMLACMESEHERAAGAWQAEWGTLTDLSASPARPPPGRATCWSISRWTPSRAGADADLGASVGADRPRAGRAPSDDAAPRDQRAGRMRPSAAAWAARSARRLQMWDGQLALADRLRLVRFDHRGHGALASPRRARTRSRTSAGDVLALLDTLGIERAHYCGLSIGGMVGMWLARQRPRADRPARPDLHLRAHAACRASGSERAAAVLAAGHDRRRSPTPVVDRWLTPAFAAEHPEARASCARCWSRHRPGRATPHAAARSNAWTCAPSCRASPRRRS